jgi:hypothetical protein
VDLAGRTQPISQRPECGNGRLAHLPGNDGREQTAIPLPPTVAAIVTRVPVPTPANASQYEPPDPLGLARTNAAQTTVESR